ncbi:hypothetical protein XNW1_4860014 [Xenorhabdus nematophila str. Websteri]|nr:hypothetical protein XNW1_4860014 [Xenorhabdus nematophila str. Websteri]
MECKTFFVLYSISSRQAAQRRCQFATDISFCDKEDINKNEKIFKSYGWLLLGKIFGNGYEKTEEYICRDIL